MFIISYDENTKKVYLDFTALVEMTSAASDIVMEGVVNTLKARDIHLKSSVFLSWWDKFHVWHLQWQRIRNHAPQAIYINCHCHWLALCIEHLFEEFPLLYSIDSLLLGLQKSFNFSRKMASFYMKYKKPVVLNL